MTESEFIGKCVKDLMNSGVTIHINSNEFRYENFSYFSTNEKHKEPFFCINYIQDNGQYNLETILHEYCHFLQWKNNSKIYKSSYKIFDNFEKWLDYKSTNMLIEELRVIQKVELDCDRRAISQIEKYNLPIDKKYYIRKTNSYILSYNYMFTDRVYFENLDFENKDLLDIMPEKQLTMSQIKKGFPKHEELFRRMIK